MEITLVQGLLLGLLYYLTLCAPPWFTGIAHVSIRQPLVCGTLTGIILGRPMDGLIIGATINTVVLGFINVGGSIPSDAGISGILGTALAISTNASPEVAITLAIPFGLLGTVIWNLRSTINSVFVHMCDRAAEKGNLKKAYFVQYVPAQIVTLLLTAVPVFVITYFGQGYIREILSMLEGTPMRILTVLGQILPAIGVVLILRLLNTREGTMYFFMLGFILTIYGNVPMLVLAIIAYIIAYFYSNIKDSMEAKHE